MRRTLMEMTDEQRWQLFPIILCPHDPKWKDAFVFECAVLERCIGKGDVVRLSHIGSTAVPGLLSKPTIDILVEISSGCDTKHLIEAMEVCGYIYSPQPGNPPPHMMFLKGYTERGFVGQAFHVHIRYAGDWSELYFRDYLIGHPDVAAAYGELKRQLWHKHEHDRDAYTEAKTEFIQRYTALARIEFQDRYRPETTNSGEAG